MASNLVCGEHKDKNECKGDVTEGRSRSGGSVYAKCLKGWGEYDRFVEELHKDVSRRYPGYNDPHSSAPAWFDESNAGERWSEDY